MEERRLVLVEITEEEEKEFTLKRNEILNSDRRTNRIPVSINSINFDEWEKAFAVAGPYTKDIMELFYFYEDGKDYARVF